MIPGEGGSQMVLSRRFMVVLACCAATAVAGEARAAVAQMCSGSAHGMALRSDGTVLTWGWDGHGQLGIGRLLYRHQAGGVAALSAIRSVSSRWGGGVLAVTADDRVLAWGDNEYGQAGIGDRAYHGNEVLRPSITGVAAVSTGGYFSLALHRDGTVSSWGDNSYGQLGNGTTEARPVPGRVAELSDVVAIGAGSTHAIALRSDGTVWAWGHNRNGQLGVGAAEDFAVRPKPVTGLNGIVAISAGAWHNLALRNDGTVWGWGYNGTGTLGDGGTTDRFVPVQAIGLAGATAIAAGGYHSAAARSDGTVWAWGTNIQGQLGAGAFDPDVHRPQPVPGVTGVRALSAGQTHTLALRSDGSVWGWGYNAWGELGYDNALYAFVNEAVPLPGLSGVTDVNAGLSVSFAVAGGNALGWGKNNYQQLASGIARPANQTTPVLVPGLDGVASIACGRYSSYALKEDGAVWAWGANGWGSLGDGTAASRSSPVRVTGLPAIAAISAGAPIYLFADDEFAVHVLAADRTGAVWAWGANTHGQLGNGELAFTNGNRYWTATPVRLAGLSGIVAVAAGSFHSFALDSSGRLFAWGDNTDGQLGDGTTARRTLPVPVPGFGGVRQIAAGWNVSMAITSDGAAWSWGSRASGELGLGPTENRLAPTRIPALSRVRTISPGADHAVAVLSDGSLWTWGGNFHGQLGDGSADDRDHPVRVLPPGSLLSAWAGNAATVAPAVGGAALAWGWNGNGQLGDGTLARHHRPQLVVGIDGVGFLNLAPGSTLELPPERIPAFSLVAAGTTTGAAATVTASIGFRPQDVGTQGNVYVFALAPAPQVALLKDGAEALVLGYARTRGGAKDAAVPCVLAQLTASGQLVGVSVGALQAHVTGVLSAQGQSVTILNGVPAVQIGGATFYVGYGPNANAMLTNGTSRSVASIPGSAQCQPQPPETGWWWNPAEDGRGFSIEVRGNNLFFASFLYDVSGRSTWYVSTGPVSLDGSLYVGDLLSARGGQTLGGSYPGFPTLRNEAPMTLAFNTASSGTLIWPGGTVPIQRFDIVPNGLNLPAVAGQPESGWWWNEAESGRGYFMEFQNGWLDIAGYMYDDAGNPVWYLTVGEIAGSATARTFSGGWWSYGNGMTLMGPWRQHRRTNDNVAPVTIQFSGPDTALMTLPNGRTTPLRRHRF
jgi:alpha-tubulin suppressor-like RCC1 family protein